MSIISVGPRLSLKAGVTASEICWSCAGRQSRTGCPITETLLIRLPEGFSASKRSPNQLCKFVDEYFCRLAMAPPGTLEFWILYSDNPKAHPRFVRRKSSPDQTCPARVIVRRDNYHRLPSMIANAWRQCLHLLCGGINSCPCLAKINVSSDVRPVRALQITAGDRGNGLPPVGFLGDTQQDAINDPLL